MRSLTGRPGGRPLQYARKDLTLFVVCTTQESSQRTVGGDVPGAPLSNITAALAINDPDGWVVNELRLRRMNCPCGT